MNLRATRHDEPVSLAGRLADTRDKTIMLYAIVLICGPSTPHLNCDETTAHRYERVPGGNELPFMCQRSAEIWAAEHVEIKAGEYPKIRCPLRRDKLRPVAASPGGRAVDDPL